MRQVNHYFGRKLEPMLFRYPGVALALQPTNLNSP
jgi:hypothetical protein